MRMSIFLAIGALAMGSLKLFWDQRFAKTAYRLLLLVNLGLLASSSHDGGSLTHGRDYLTKYMPNVIRPIFGLSVEAKSTANSVDDLVVFKDLIHPIIEQNCLTCHNPDKQKGELSLETYAGHLEGGDMGPSVVPKHILRRRTYINSPDMNLCFPIIKSHEFFAFYRQKSTSVDTFHLKPYLENFVFLHVFKDFYLVFFAFYSKNVLGLIHSRPHQI